jgi:hypothetical protein
MKWDGKYEIESAFGANAATRGTSQKNNLFWTAICNRVFHVADF